MKRYRPCSVATCIILCLYFAASFAAAEMLPVKKIRVGTPPFFIIEELIRSNQDYISGYENNKNAVKLPYVTWLTGVDSRISANLLLEKPSSKIFIINSVGNQLINAEAEIDYGVRHMHTPLLLITGNSDDELIRNFIFRNKKASAAFSKKLDAIADMARQLQPVAEENDQENTAARLSRLIEMNIDRQVALAMGRYTDRVTDGRLVIVGAIIDLADTYGFGARKLVIINWFLLQYLVRQNMKDYLLAVHS